MSINAKRDKFRDEIRKKEREAFFLQQRNKNLNLQNQKFTVQQHLVEQLLQNQNVEVNLVAILNVIKTTHYQAGTMILIEKGLIPVLVSFLNNEAYTCKTLEILSFLTQIFTQKQKQHSFNLCTQLYQLGIFQYLVKLLKLKQGGVFSAFILYRFCQFNQDFCEAIFQGEVYRILIGQLMQTLQKFPYVQLDDRADQYSFCVYILKTLENIASLKSFFDYTQQKCQIMKLVGLFMERRHFLKITFGIFYQIITTEKPNFITEELVVLINPILRQTESDSKYLMNMLASIYRLQPHHLIDYSLVFKTALKNSKTYKILSLIFQGLLKGQKYNLIPTNDIFWQKILTGSLNDEDTFVRLLRVAGKTDIQISFLCRIISVALQQEKSYQVQSEGLFLLDIFVKDQRQLDLRLNQVNKHRILSLLQKIGSRKDIYLRQRASWLSDYILGPMTEMSSRIESL